MARKATLTLSFLTAAFAGVALVACGGSGGASGASANSGASGGGVVAQVEGTPITRAAVSHWMGTLAGSDYFQYSRGGTVPEGLVSDPANYPRCIARMESIIASAPNKNLAPAGVDLLTKCREMHQALKEQATAYLVNAQWVVDSFRHEGVTVSDEEVIRSYKQQFATEAARREFLAAKRFAPSDQLLVMKLDLLDQKGLKKIAASGKHGYAKFLAAGERVTAKTSCSPGYVVEHCEQYKPGTPQYSGTTPAVLMEQVAAIVNGQCTNIAACAKQ